MRRTPLRRVLPDFRAGCITPKADQLEHSLKVRDPLTPTTHGLRVAASFNQRSDRLSSFIVIGKLLCIKLLHHNLNLIYKEKSFRDLQRIPSPSGMRQPELSSH